MLDKILRKCGLAPLSNSQREAMDAQIVNFLRESREKQFGVNLLESASAKDLLSQSKEDQCELSIALLEQLHDVSKQLDRKGVYSSNDPLWREQHALEILLGAMMRKKLPYRVEQLEAGLKIFARSKSRTRHGGLLKQLVSAVERFVNQSGSLGLLRPYLQTIEGKIREPKWGCVYTDDRRLADRIHRLIDDSDNHQVFEIPVCDSWTAELAEQASQLKGEEARALSVLLRHCSTLNSSKPTKRFLKLTRENIEGLGERRFTSIMLSCLGTIGNKAPPHADFPREYDRTLLSGHSTDLLRGLIWSCPGIQSEELIEAIANAADAAFKKIPLFGQRAPTIGNSCVWALSEIGSKSAIAQLARLKARIKQNSTTKLIERTLASVAAKQGISLDELEEQGVPTFGLSAVGKREESLAEYIAEVRITGTTRAEIQWQRVGGKIQKSVPKTIRENHQTELKELKATVQGIQKMLPAQRDRLESLFLADRTWDFETWRERYLDHPLVGFLVRRLVWTISTTTDESSHEVTWLEDRLVDCQGAAVDCDWSSSKVSIWHPATANSQQVIPWREFFEKREIKQPFKQAHREIYLLTPAEYETQLYSNRFAAHVLEQSKLRALCTARGWSMGAIGGWDYGDVKPVKKLPARNLRVEYWIDTADDELNDSGLYARIATDQVRFYQLEDTAPLPLDQVPSLVFSEIMRDVDLFVGVASVGNNPEWQDGGPEGRYRDYWNAFSFGDLSGTAQTRKEILSRLVPRLKIGDRCRFDDKFLIVRGNRRTYKIHLGSSNILMEPNDQYLCIVASRGQAMAAGGKVFLPFEGDERLAVILSKAFLLAEDTKITDATILSQIGR